MGEEEDLKRVFVQAMSSVAQVADAKVAVISDYASEVLEALFLKEEASRLEKPLAFHLFPT